MNLFNTDKLQLYSTALDAASLRHRVIANNVANVDTPHYKRQDVSFQYQLEEAVKKNGLQAYRTDGRHIPFSNANGSSGLGYSVFTDKNRKMNNNNNSVDIEYEMMSMAQNQIQYNMLLDKAGSHFNKIKSVLGKR
jgi:flagellar basal-body rod protein FlgB